MISSLRNHPFAMEAFFESSVVVTFAFPKEQLQPLIPKCLSLDTHNDHWAFIAVAMVETRNMRIKGWPAWSGRNFFLAGYRVFVKYKTVTGKRLRGLYILKSETDSKLMELLSRYFTRYQFATTDIDILKNTEYSEIRSVGSDFILRYHHPKTKIVKLPEESPFTDWNEARRFAGPLPFTFYFNQNNNQVTIVEGVRENWKPQPIEIVKNHFSFFEKMNLHQPVLCSGFVVEKLPYYWKNGRTEQWH